MFTRCPNCRAAFSITDQQLAIASGMVRCGVCEHVFDARLYLFKQAEEKLEEVDVTLESDPHARIDAEIDPLAEAEIIARQVNTRIPSDEVIEHDMATQEFAIENLPEIPKIIADQVSDLEHDRAKLNPLTLLGFVAIGILLTTLSVQAIAIYQQELLPTSLRTKFCGWITCVHKIPRALNQIEILNRSIYTHPHEKNALMVTVTIINRAEFAQPYPVVELRFLDVAGEIMAARKFNPHDYLKESWHRQSIMQPARPTSIQLEVIDFGEDVIGYEFDFF